MIPVYNCSIYIKSVLQSVLQQDPGVEEMQIEIVDDCSTDTNVEQLVKEIGEGRVLYYRQPQNKGSLRNFETCINRARGYYIHLLHGDDRVKDGFYKQIAALFDRFPEAGAAYCAWDYIDTENNLLRHSRIEAQAPCILDNWLYKLAEHQRLQYVTIAVKREVYEKLGGFYCVTYGEDWEMWARIAAHYPTAYTPEFLAEYREHNDSISNQSFLTGKNIRDIVKVIDIITTYLPTEDQKWMNRLARKRYMTWAFDFTNEQWYSRRNKQAVYTQMREISKAYRDANLVIKMIRLLILMELGPLRKRLRRLKRY
jgi:glycosyltransferase involved in cell wall biosynthesis